MFLWEEGLAKQGTDIFILYKINKNFKNRLFFSFSVVFVHSILNFLVLSC